jgi:hypothetical protein
MTYMLASVVEGAREERGASGGDFVGDRGECALRADGEAMRAQLLALVENGPRVVVLRQGVRSAVRCKWSWCSRKCRLLEAEEGRKS